MRERPYYTTTEPGPFNTSLSYRRPDPWPSSAGRFGDEQPNYVHRLMIFLGHTLMLVNVNRPLTRKSCAGSLRDPDSSITGSPHHGVREGLRTSTENQYETAINAMKYPMPRCAPPRIWREAPRPAWMAACCCNGLGSVTALFKLHLVMMHNRTRSDGSAMNCAWSAPSPSNSEVVNSSERRL